MGSTKAGLGWMPQETTLQQICGLLASYHDPRADHQAVFRQLEECQKHGEFLLYLAFILGHADGAVAEVRMGAGLFLKNSVRGGALGPGAPQLEGVKGMLLTPLAHPVRAIRTTTGSVISALVGAVGLRAWPEVVLGLGECLRSDQPLRVLGGLDALRKVAEDHGRALEEVVESLPQRPVHLLAPALLAQLSNPAAEARQLALDCLYELTEQVADLGPGALDGAVQGLFRLAMDSDGGVKRRVCRALVQVLQLYPDRLEPHMGDLIAYMLANTQSNDAEIALESCEFWTAFCVSHLDDSLIDMLRSSLPQLVTLLMGNMVYDDTDDDVIEAVEEEEAIARGVVPEDKDSEIRPSFGRAPSGGKGGGGSDEEGEDDDEESYGVWNLRKSSAQGIDSLSETYGDSLLPILLPIVEARVQEADWKLRESALLALGAVSTGCIQGLRPYIQQMAGLMIPMTADAQPLVRSIACWALGRYSYELATGTRQSAEGAQLYDRALLAVAERSLDRHRKVQAAAISALAVFVEESEPELLVQKLPVLVDVLVQAASLYGRKNMRLLYDAMVTLGERLAGTSQLRQPETAQKLFPPLLQRLHALSEHDAEALPLLACLASLVISLGASSGEFCSFLFERSVRVLQVQGTLKRGEALQGAVSGGQADLPEYNPEMVSAALDLLGGVAEALGPQTEALVAARGQGLEALLAAACGDGHDGVRRSGFALLGELGRTCPARVLGAAGSAMECAVGIWAPLVVQCLHPPRLVTGSAVSAASNACWAVGELAAPIGRGGLEPVVAALVDAIAPLLSRTSGFKRSMLENAAIAIGRLALSCPEPLAPHLEAFIWNWCAALAAVRDGPEKQQAFLGLCALVKGNPTAGLRGFAVVCEALASWQEAPPEVARESMALLGQFQAHLAALGQWQGYWTTVRPVMRTKLQAMYAAATGAQLPT